MPAAPARTASQTNLQAQPAKPGVPAVPPAIAPIAPPPKAPAPAKPAPAAGPPRVAPVVSPAARPTAAGAAPRPPPAAPPKVAPAVGVPAVAKVAPPAPAATKAAAAVDPARAAQVAQWCQKLDSLDYFQLLQLGYEAVPTEIKKAFYRDSRQYHPDRYFHLEDPVFKGNVNELYKRVTEAYYVLRDDQKRRKYLADIRGPERARKLRFSEASEVEQKAAARKEQEEQVGTHPKGRQLFQTGVADLEAGRLPAAERNLKMALTFEPQNARYKEKLAEVHRRINEASKGTDPFKIK